MAHETASVERSLVRKVAIRLALPAILIMLLSSLDRVNVSFAALKMMGDLAMSPSQYGFASGILFAGFLAGQYPSILALQRVGFRWWLAISVLLWGIATGLLGLIENKIQFCVLRAVIGFAEGGLAPGLVFYLSQFASERERARTFTYPMVAIPLSIIVGGPISGLLLDMHGPFGLASWRWMFIAEALPTVLGACIVLFYFRDRPDQVGWLNEPERRWLAQNAVAGQQKHTGNDWSALRFPVVWLSAALWFCLLSGSYGIMFWLPAAMKQLGGLGPIEIGVLNSLPWLGNVLAMFGNAYHTDRTGERFWHVAMPAVLAGAALLAVIAPLAAVPRLVLLIMAGSALGAAQGAFWALPRQVLSKRKLAVAIVTINIAGSSGGLVMPILVGLIRQWSGNFNSAFVLLSILLMLGAALVGGIALTDRRPRRADA